ncbi:MAG: TraR/DksA C4-type zinc finger protein [Thermoleophilia bacterium]|nr:TraR/DksA C4-type zinc finger protein [Thermoleophilia bacterium]MDH5333842.1 TraR/DksA C4-type zinc finger protein [Thermoleophilia bacterium]
MTVDLESRRLELIALRDRLTQAAEAIVRDDEDDGELNSSAGDQHIADHASDTFEREMDQTLEENAEHILAEIESALAGIDEGTYGRCRVCGEEIPEERLEAVPYATLCLDDKRRQELM